MSEPSADRPKRTRKPRGAPEYPLCPACDKRDDVIRRGSRAGKKLHHCRACRHTFSGPPLVRPDYPCPFCPGHCHKNGKRPGGGQIYLCNQCHRINTNLLPAHRHAHAGTCRYPLILHLDPKAFMNLTRYCRAHRLSMSQAVRAILGQAATRRIGSTRQQRYQAPPIPDPTVPLHRFPSATLDAALRKRGLPRHQPTVYVEYKACVRLDAAAHRGLARTAETLGITHQEAARWLIGNARLPGDPIGAAAPQQR
jgi:hypothetical protein